jgi:hypothetical protein
VSCLAALYVANDIEDQWIRSDNILVVDELWPKTQVMTITYIQCTYVSKYICVLFYISHHNIYNFVDVLLEVQFETYIKYRSKGVKTKKMCEQEAL